MYGVLLKSQCSLYSTCRHSIKFWIILMLIFFWFSRTYLNRERRLLKYGSKTLTDFSCLPCLILGRRLLRASSTQGKGFEDPREPPLPPLDTGGAGTPERCKQCLYCCAVSQIIHCDKIIFSQLFMTNKLVKFHSNRHSEEGFLLPIGGGGGGAGTLPP